MNEVILVGRLTRDPELRYTGDQTPVVSFNLAVDRTFKNKDGEREADFPNCIAWRKTAELIAENLTKGRRIGVVGRLQTRSYDDKDGKKVYVTEVVVDRFEFLDSKPNSSDGNGQSAPSSNNSNYSSSNSNGGNEDFGGSDGFLDIGDDDIPF